MGRTPRDLIVMAGSADRGQSGKYKAKDLDRSIAMSTRPAIPTDVVDWFRNVFRAANWRLTETLSLAIELEGQCYGRLRSSDDFREGVEALLLPQQAKKYSPSMTQLRKYSLLTCGEYDLSCVRRAHRTCHFDPGRRPVCT